MLASHTMILVLTLLVLLAQPSTAEIKSVGLTGRLVCEGRPYTNDAFPLPPGPQAVSSARRALDDNDDGDDN